MIKRWSLGLLASAFIAGTAFVLSTILLRLFRVYLHGASAQPTWLDVNAVPVAIAIALTAGAAALFVWSRITREP